MSVIPPPSAVVLVGDATLPISIFLSVTVRVVLFTVVVVPLTVRLPETVRSLLIVVVPEPAPMLRVVAAPKALTDVALALNTENVVLAVVTPVVKSGLVANTNLPVPVSSLITLASSELVVEACALIFAALVSTVPVSSGSVRVRAAVNVAVVNVTA